MNDSGERLVSQEKLGIPNLILFNIGKKSFHFAFTLFKTKYSA